MILCRVLPHSSGDGPTNMALDEALLDSVASDPTSSLVRTYEWSIPTLSLGYFQKISEAEADPRWLGAAIVRRPTGGGALWHDLEITYAVVVPSTHPLARPSSALYRAIHEAIAKWLRIHHVPAHRRGPEASDDEPASKRPFLCFSDRDDDDVVVGPVKLVGSAQRRRAGAVLQHGSLLLGRSPTTPELLGLRQVARRQTRHLTPEPNEFARVVAGWATILRDILPIALDGMTSLRDFTDWERDRADVLKRHIYENPAWTRRR